MDDKIAVLRFVAGQNGDRFLPLIAEPAVEADMTVVVSKEHMRGAIFVNTASTVIGAAALRVKHQCLFVRVFFKDGHGERLAWGVCPGGIGGIHQHVVSVMAIFGMASAFVAGMVNVRRGDGVALAISKPCVPGVHGVGILRLRFGGEHRDRIGEGAAIVGRKLVNPVGLVRAVTKKQVDITVIHLDEL